MKIQEYKYKIRLTMMTEPLVLEYSLEDFVTNYGWASFNEFPFCNFELISREKGRVIYSEIIKSGERAPTYIARALLDGASEERAIPKKTLATIGEMLKAKKTIVGPKDSHESK